MLRWSGGTIEFIKIGKLEKRLVGVDINELVVGSSLEVRN